MSADTWDESHSFLLNFSFYLFFYRVFSLRKHRYLVLTIAFIVDFENILIFRKFFSRHERVMLQRKRIAAMKKIIFVYKKLGKLFAMSLFGWNESRVCFFDRILQSSWWLVREMMWCFHY